MRTAHAHHARTHIARAGTPHTHTQTSPDVACGVWADERRLDNRRGARPVAGEARHESGHVGVQAQVAAVDRVGRGQSEHGRGGHSAESGGR